MYCFIIVPAFNEERTILKVIKAIQASYSILHAPYSIVTVDDGSADQTATEAARAGAVVLRHAVNRGQGAALRTGNEYALARGADIVAHFDADGQHQADDIIKLIEPIVEGRVEVVLGSRFIKSRNKKLETRNNFKFKDLLVTGYSLLVTKDIPFFRRLLLFGGWLVNTLTTGVLLTDVHNGLRAFAASALRRMSLNQDRMAHATEYIQEMKRLRFSHVEVPVVVSYTGGLKPSQGFFHGLKILRELAAGKVIR